jgi:serine/threonine protein kinase
VSVSESTPTRSFKKHTQTRTILGTPNYISPEQIQKQTLDPHSDIFSLNCILYKTATKHRPFKNNSQLETLYTIVHDEPPPVESLNKTPPELNRLIRRCLTKSPNHHYQTITDLTHDLRELRRDATPVSQSVKPPVLAGLGPRPRLRWVTAGALTAVVMLGAGVNLKSRTKRGASSTSRTPGLLQVEKLTSRGNVSRPTISPDGRYLTYASPDETGITIWLRDLTERTEARLVAPIKIAYLDGIRFGQDG